MCINQKLSTFALLAMVPILIGLVSSSNEVFAVDSFTDSVSLTIPASCSMGGTVNADHTASLQNGTYSASTGSDYENGIGKTTLTVFCNDNNGFSVYAIGYTGDTDSGDNINKLVGQNTGSMIDTKVYSSGDTTSNWSMKVNKVASSEVSYLPNNMTITNSYDNWHIVPNAYDQVLTYKAETGSSATDATLGAKLETTYAAYISSTQPADTYQGKVKYVLVNPYNAEAPEPIISIADAVYLQDVNACPTDLTTGQVYTLKDARDEQEYKVAKLADGNCWMLENLALDPTDSTTAANMNASNTNASSEAITNYLNGGSITTGWSNIAVADVDTGFDSFTAPMINNASKDTLVTGYGPAAADGQVKVGIYYNFCAATVGTYCYEQNGGVDIPDSLIDAPMDVCPAGWRMPTGGAESTGEYTALFLNYSQTAANSDSLQYNLSAPLSGSYSAGEATSQNAVGNWWSSTYSHSSSMLILLVNPSLTIQIPSQRGLGVSIRCILAS